MSFPPRSPTDCQLGSPLALCVQPGSQAGTGAPLTPSRPLAISLTASFFWFQAWHWAVGLRTYQLPRPWSHSGWGGDMAGAMLGCKGLGGSLGPFQPKSLVLCHNLVFKPIQYIDGRFHKDSLFKAGLAFNKYLSSTYYVPCPAKTLGLRDSGIFISQHRGGPCLTPPQLLLLLLLLLLLPDTNANNNDGNPAGG